MLMYTCCVAARAAGGGGLAGGEHQGQGEARLQQRGALPAARRRQIRPGQPHSRNISK